METQKTPKSQSNTERKAELKEQSSLTSGYIQSYSHQDSMVLAQKHKYRPIEHDREP